MLTRMASLVVAALLAAFTFTSQVSAQAITASDAFGSGANAFAIDFVNVGNAVNAADTTGYGAVVYSYRISTYNETALDGQTVPDPRSARSAVAAGSVLQAS